MSRYGTRGATGTPANLTEAAAQQIESKQVSEELSKFQKQKRKYDAAMGLVALNPPILSPGEVPYFNSTSGMDILNSSMSNVIKKIFPTKVLNAWNDKGRGIYEISSGIDAQCIATIGTAQQAKNCWLCGLGLDLTLRNAELKPSCDHILPIAQATFFLGVYSTRKRMNANETNNIFSGEIFNLEYAWAHLGCNLVKVNDVLIKETIVNNAPVWSPDETAITNLLLRIQSDNRTPQIQRLIKTNPEWLNQRKTAMINRILPITNFINRPPEDAGLGNLTVLAGWASLVDPTSMSPSFLEKIHVNLPNDIIDTSRRRSSSTEEPPAKRQRTGARRTYRMRKFARNTRKNRKHK